MREFSSWSVNAQVTHVLGDFQQKKVKLVS